MIYRIADNIYSPYARDVEGNVRAVLEGRAMPVVHPGVPGGIEDYCASVFDWEKEGTEDGLSRLETILYRSVLNASLQVPGLDLSSERVLFVFSTTKGNIDLLVPGAGFPDDSRLLLWESARKVATRFGNNNEPVVVSNACISGVSAQILAKRLLEAGIYDYAVVAGGDVLSDFIISGFQSFKALSGSRCRSFDAERTGLNLGEAAATLIYASSRTAGKFCRPPFIAMADGAMANDANHISGPSRMGEGLFRTLDAMDFRGIVPDFVCCHGTATAYNDEMEAIALGRASLADVRVNSLKGYFGHTLGAAGVLETVFSMAMMRMGLVVAVPEFGSLGVSVPLDVVSETVSCDVRSFVKTISGFGGCNASAFYVMADDICDDVPKDEKTGYKEYRLEIRDRKLTLDGEVLMDNLEEGDAVASDIYRRMGLSYPKFFKMDIMSRLGFVAAEILVRKAGVLPEDTAVVLSNSSASLDDDVKYAATAVRGDGYFPSPALFVYTLPNIVTGEIAIRHKFYGETMFCVCPGDMNDILLTGVNGPAIYGVVEWYAGSGYVDIRLRTY